MKTKYVLLLIILLFILLFVGGCKKEVSREYINDNVTVAESEYKAGKTWVTTSVVNKIPHTTVHNIPAEYNICFKYKSFKIHYNDKDLYDKYNNREGEVIKAKLCLKYYDDDSSECEIEELY